jgi:hypothetical protein
MSAPLAEPARYPIRAVSKLTGIGSRYAARLGARYGAGHAHP